MISILSGASFMKILLIGGGGREHALAWNFAQHGHSVYAVPGNPGIAEVAKLVASTEYSTLAESLGVDLTVVGPEAPLVAGIVDDFRTRRLPIIGPTKEQARLEGSKVYSKQFMTDAAIPTARSVQVHDAISARTALDQFNYPLVIKADGLAAGKGVIIAAGRTDALAAINTLGSQLVIEEFLEGEEVSFIAVCDGRTALPLEASQDHKTIADNDTGPNTGGMGAYSDGRIIDASTAAKIMDTIILPTVERTAFTGFLYAGLMMTIDGPKVLEFNVRMGDPETQPLMHRMKSDFASILKASVTDGLNGLQLQWRPEPSVCVVMSASGYPGDVRRGDPITGVEESEADVFQAGTRRNSGQLETWGGRVLGVTSRGEDLQTAIAATYNAVRRIHFDGMHYRSDIGRKGLRRW